MKLALSYFLIAFIAVHQVSCSSESVKNSTIFTFDFYRAIFNPNKNVVVSPYSVRLLLSILYQASHGTTSSQLQYKTYFAGKDDNKNLLKSEISHVFASSSVKLANKVFVKEGGFINQHFQSVIDDYKSEVQAVNFKNKDQVANTINSWVENKTNNLIKNLVDPSSIDADTALYLVNALYFKASWAEPFPKDSVRNESFTAFDGTKHSIPFMVQDTVYRTAEIDSLQSFVIEIPYTIESNFVFWILMPNPSSSISVLASNFKLNDIAEMSTKLQPDNCILKVPLIEVSTEVDLKSTLQTLGITSLFSKTELNILDNVPLQKVTDGKQKNKIIVNTEGTEAASGNYFSISFNSMPSYININRPFIYMILTADTLEPVFVGHYSKPN